MVTAATGTLALTSLRSLNDIIKDIRNANDPEKLRIAASQMLELTLQAREEVFALQEERNAAVNELATLKTEIEKRNKFGTQRDNYERELDASGSHVYREKSAESPRGKSPYICPHCFQNEKIAMMQPYPGANTALPSIVYKCPACELSMRLTTVKPGN